MRNYERLREQDARDVITMTHVISTPLHYTTKTKQCSDPTACPMCSNAARLAVQHYRPIIERRVIEQINRQFDVRCTMSHPGGD